MRMWNNLTKSVLFSFAMLFVAGCGGDKVKAELESYCKTVVSPIFDEEVRLESDLEHVTRVSGQSEDRSAEMLEFCERSMVPTYSGIVRILSGSKGTAPEIKRLNAELLGHYTALLASLQEWAEAAHRNDSDAMSRTSDALNSPDGDALKDRLEAMCKKHGVQLEW
jgi:hypothetical protein